MKLGDAQNSSSCLIQDISFMGLKITLAGRFPKDAAVGMRIFLADECILNVEGWVVWQRTIDGHNIYGLCFTKLADADKEKIYKFIRYNFPREMDEHWWKNRDEAMGGEAMEDRRIFDRFPAQFGLKYLDLNTNREGSGRTQDISARGIGMVVNEALAAHTPLELWVSLPDRGDPFYARGEVAWSNKLVTTGVS